MRYSDFQSQVKRNDFFVDVREGDWITVQQVHKNLKAAHEQVISVLDERGLDTPVRIRDHWGGVVWSNEDLIKQSK